MAKRYIKRGSTTFVFDDKDFDAIRKSNEIVAAVRSEAEQMAARAKANAPAESGEYRDSIRVETSKGRTRARAHVVAESEHAIVIESRTGNLRRAAGG